MFAGHVRNANYIRLRSQLFIPQLLLCTACALHGDKSTLVPWCFFVFLISRTLDQCQRSAPLSCKGFVYMLVSVCVCVCEREEGGRHEEEEACSGWRGCQLINLHSSPSVVLHRVTVQVSCHYSSSCTRVLGMRGANGEGGKGSWGIGGGGTWGPWHAPFTNALLVPRKLKPRHLVSFPTFVYSFSSLPLPAVCLSNHRPGTVWVNEGLGSTLPPLPASIHLGKDCPPLWWDTQRAKPPIPETFSVFPNHLI